MLLRCFIVLLSSSKNIPFCASPLTARKVIIPGNFLKGLKCQQEQEDWSPGVYVNNNSGKVLQRLYKWQPSLEIRNLSKWWAYSPQTELYLSADLWGGAEPQIGTHTHTFPFWSEKTQTYYNTMLSCRHLKARWSWQCSDWQRCYWPVFLMLYFSFPWQKLNVYKMSEYSDKHPL